MQEGQMNLRLKGPDIYVPTSGLWYLQVNLEKLTLYAYLMEEYPDNPDPDPDPQTNVWSLIGSMTDWVGDIDMTAGADGATYDLTIELAEGDEFKFRKNADWDQGDLGANASNNTLTEGTMLLLAKGANIAVAQSGKWHLVLDPGTPSLEVELVEAYTDPENPPQETDYWGVVGEFNDWGSNPDIVMDHNEPYWTTQIVLKKDAQFKFRMNDAWVNDLGVDSDDYGTSHYISTGSVLSLRAGGPNLVSPVHGLWSLMLNPEKGILEVMLIEEYPDDPNPEDPEEPFTGWSIIGSMNGEVWSVDHDLTEYKLDDGSVAYIIEIDLVEGDEFKFRKGHDWDVNLGVDSSENPYTFTDHILNWSDESTFEVPDIPLARNGSNLRVPVSGTWTLELYPDDAVAIAYRVQE